MARSYDARRRRAQAEETRRRILDAAVQLHAQGIFAVEPLARAAGVSVPTVRKHFPRRESIFEGCTRHFFEGFEPPPLERLAEVEPPAARVAAVVAALCDAHEATNDLLWYSAPEADASPALGAAQASFDQLVEAATDAVLGGGPPVSAATRARVRALLDPLAYRAFRTRAGLDAAATRDALTAAVLSAAGLPPPDSRPEPLR